MEGQVDATGRTIMNDSRGNCAIVATVVRWTVTGLFTPPVLSADASQTAAEAPILQAVESQIIRSTVPRPMPVLHAVPEGKVVKKGDLLVELDNASLTEELHEQELRTREAQIQMQAAADDLSAARLEAAGAVELAQGALALAKMARVVFIDGEYPVQLQEAETAVNLAKERKIYAEKRIKQATASGKDAADRLAQAQFELSEAEAGISAAQNRLHLLKDVLFPYRESQLQLALAEKEIAVSRLQIDLKRAVRDAEAKAELTRERHQIEDERRLWLQKHIGDCKIKAPRAGRVLYVRPTQGRGYAAISLEPGSQVRRHQPLVYLVSTKRFKLEVPLSLAVAQRLETGRKAPVCVDALLQQTFQGRITNIRVLPQPVSPSAEAMATVTVEDAKSCLRPGMSAKVEFVP